MDSVATRWISAAASRVDLLYTAVVAAHEVGHGPGAETEPWSHRFQLSAVPAYTAALPSPYLLTIAATFAETSDLMVSQAAPKSIARQWHIVESYLRATSDALLERDVDKSQTIASYDAMTSPTSLLLPVPTLAEMVARDAAFELMNSAQRVVEQCKLTTHPPLEDRELDWLRRLSRRERVIDIAISSGYSERGFYRRLDAVWHRLNVSGRDEGIRLAMKEGWID